MTSIGSPSPFFLAGKKAYAVDRSLRLNDGDSAYLSRTPSSTSNRKTWTFSAWVKRSNITTGAFQTLFSANNSSNYGLYGTYIWFTTTDTLAISINSGIYYLQTNAVFRDIGAWYHVVVNIDTTQATSSNRMKIYVNGVQETSFATTTYPTQDLDSSINLNQQHTIGGRRYTSIDNYFDGYIAEVNFIDGLQYDASYFGETDPITGQWNPKKYVGSYGTNGFYLPLSDNSDTTATTLGKDNSGNSNNWTPNNFSVAAGAGNDSVEDTPTNNFCTMNPLFMNATEVAGTMSDGNLTWRADNNYCTGQATFSVKTGKWYWEAELNSQYVNIGGITRGTNAAENTYIGYDTNGNLFGFGYYFSAGTVKGNGSDGTTSNQNLATSQTTFANGDICGFASDIPNGTLAFYKNGTLVYTITGINSSFDWMPSFSAYGTSAGFYLNFGQRAFAHTPPTGHQALCSANLPDPTILLPNKHFDTTLYTGNETARSFSLNFGADWIWLKERSAGGSHRLFDSVRGANNLLISSQTTEELVRNNEVPSFSATGFNIGNAATVNENSVTNVAWTWNAGDTDGKTYVVKVHDFSGNNRYIFDNFQTEAVTLDLAEGGTYIFNMDDASNASHPFMIGTTANDNTTAFGSGIVYKLDGVVKTFAQYHAGFAAATTRRLEFTIPASTNNLFYFCYVHSGMGGQINTNSTLGSSNFDGNVQAVVKANATAGFSIVAYTGNGNTSASTTIGHGLGVSPDVIITKKRNSTGTDFGWSTWHHKLLHASYGQDVGIWLDKTNGQNADMWDGYSNFSSTVFTPADLNYNNVNNATYINYIFSEVAGYSKFGSYTGNGNANGTFVFTGFRPALIIIKRTDSSSGANWLLLDDKRNTFNVVNKNLFGNLNNAEADTDRCDFLSNGFKFRQSGTTVNTSSGTYIYLAFAESPFKNARAR